MKCIPPAASPEPTGGKNCGGAGFRCVHLSKCFNLEEILGSDHCGTGQVCCIPLSGTSTERAPSQPLKWELLGAAKDRVDGGEGGGGGELFELEGGGGMATRTVLLMC